jgi:polyhydroxyalkanoate synthesis regulator phasin
MTFIKGLSGNPAGRPKGIIDKRSELRNLLEEHSQDILKKLVERAIVGEPGALKLCVERLLPRIKTDDRISFELPEGRIDDLDNMLEIIQVITEAVASGKMSMEDAEKFTEFLKRQRGLYLAVEIKKAEAVRDAKWKQDHAARMSMSASGRDDAFSDG